jgi:hypothetical protein
VCRIGSNGLPVPVTLERVETESEGGSESPDEDDKKKDKVFHEQVRL